MKGSKMDSEYKMFTWIVGIAVAGILTLALGTSGLNNARIKTYVENGYTRATLPGAADATWVKEDKSN